MIFISTGQHDSASSLEVLDYQESMISISSGKHESALSLEVEPHGFGPQIFRQIGLIADHIFFTSRGNFLWLASWLSTIPSHL